jgi:hypothetical protein
MTGSNQEWLQNSLYTNQECGQKGNEWSEFWGAHTTRVLVSAARRNDLFLRT